jgi:UDP-N-acetylmuramate--alanine ligase
LELETRDCGQSGAGQPLGHYGQLDLGSLAGSIHFVGIGGIGMSGIARLLIAQGVSVSGSDREANSITEQLARLGARISIGHRPENIDGAGAIVVSTAITESNPELVAARANGLPVWHRAQLLWHLSHSSKLIAVSGTHGKTTTTGMIAQVLLDGGLAPSVAIGGVFPKIGANAALGSGEFFVAEADESDGTHAHAESYIALITNIEADHLENFPGGIEQIRDNMVSFANSARQSVIICADDLGCRLIRSSISRPVLTYGLASASPDADYTYESLPGFAMKVSKSGTPLGELELKVPGEHNKLNALAAAVVGLELGLDFSEIARALFSFGGVGRRFEILGREREITVVDDYAHHPTEVVATLEAAVQYRRQSEAQASRVVIVFQPHQPRRLKDLWEEFCTCFQQADLVLLTDIYIARGKPIEGITSESFAQAVKHASVRYLSGPVSELPGQILSHLQPGDMVLTVGAGDITKVGPEILRLLRQGRCDGRDT